MVDCLGLEGATRTRKSRLSPLQPPASLSPPTLVCFTHMSGMNSIDTEIYVQCAFGKAMPTEVKTAIYMTGLSGVAGEDWSHIRCKLDFHN